MLQVNVPYSQDIENTTQFREYIERTPALFPLLFKSAEAKKEVMALRKQVITEIENFTEQIEIKSLLFNKTLILQINNILHEINHHRTNIYSHIHLHT